MIPSVKQRAMTNGTWFHVDRVENLASPLKDGKRLFSEGQIPRGELSRYDSKTKRFEPFLGGISAKGSVFSKDGKSVVYVSYPEAVLWKANADGVTPCN